MRYRATFQRGSDRHETRWHATPKAAQNALMRQAGQFHYLGDVCGDASEPGQPCEWAPRNGGAVSIEVQE